MDIDLARLHEQRTLFTGAIRAPRTIASYAQGWRHFSAWCERAGLASLPCTSDTLSLYAVAMIGAGLTFSTVQSRVTAVSQKHKHGGEASPLGPLVRNVITGARRVHKRPQKAMKALTADELRRIYRSLDGAKAHGSRNRSVLALGFACALRRSEICALDLADVTFEPQGVRVRLRWSKTDQEGEGRDIGVFRGKTDETCPIALLLAWLARRGWAAGPLFPRIMGSKVTSRRLSGTSIWALVRNCAHRIGLPRAAYGGHSLRAGFVTAAVAGGASDLAIMQTTGHRSVQTVYRYVRPASAFACNPLENVL